MRLSDLEGSSRGRMSLRGTATLNSNPRDFRKLCVNNLLTGFYTYFDYTYTHFEGSPGDGILYGRTTEPPTESADRVLGRKSVPKSGWDTGDRHRLPTRGKS